MRASSTGPRLHCGRIDSISQRVLRHKITCSRVPASVRSCSKPHTLNLSNSEKQHASQSQRDIKARAQGEFVCCSTVGLHDIAVQPSQQRWCADTVGRLVLASNSKEICDTCVNKACHLQHMPVMYRNIRSLAAPTVPSNDKQSAIRLVQEDLNLTCSWKCEP